MNITGQEWKGETVAIFASGPSMAQEMADRCRGVYRSIAVNMQALDVAPWADVIWASDFKWWKEYGPRAMALPGRKFQILQGQNYVGCETLFAGVPVFDDRPGYISTGGNGGYAALCLAVKFGAARVLLYGFDMRLVEGKARRFTYPNGLNTTPRFSHWIRNFDRLAPELRKRGVEVINCTPGSGLKCFKSESAEGATRAA